MIIILLLCNYSISFLDDGVDKVLEERKLEKARPVVVEEVDYEALDVGTVLAVVHRQENLSIPQCPQVIQIFILFLKL